MSLTKRRRIAAATIVAALALGSAGNAAAEDTEESWQIRGKIHAAGGTSDARALPGTVELLHQAACHQAANLLADGEPGRVKVEMTVWRQTGPADATDSRIPEVNCDDRLERESAFRTAARVIYPRPDGGSAKSSLLSLGSAVELAARSANRLAPAILETGREASITIVAAHDQKSIRQMIRSLAIRYRLDPGTAVAVAQCESGLNPRAYSPPYAGVFQHSTRFWGRRAATYGHAGESVFDPYANIDVALRMVRAGGWGPWGCA